MTSQHYVILLLFCYFIVILIVTLLFCHQLSLRVTLLLLLFSYPVIPSTSTSTSVYCKLYCSILCMSIIPKEEGTQSPTWLCTPGHLSAQVHNHNPPHTHTHAHTHMVHKHKFSPFIHSLTHSFCCCHHHHSHQSR